VFTIPDLRVLFPDDREDALSEALRRLVKDGILIRAAKGIYVYAHGDQDRQRILERVGSAFRRGEQIYISLESALSLYGVISQVPIDHLTLMTTGKKGRLRTPWGTIEMTHTARDVTDVVTSTVKTDGPLRLASPATALRDLRRVGRNLHLIDMDEFQEADRNFRERAS
jgi:predicted transcriptional regulator of viral defense system